MSPFRASLDYNPPLFPEEQRDVAVLSIHAHLRRCRWLWTATRKALLRMAECNATTATCRRRPAPQYQEHPFLNKTWDTCSVVGNGGILANSRCGERIDSAELVFRCNLAPLSKGYEKDVGRKTYLVTMNPSILSHKYGFLMEHRRPFVEKLHSYGNVYLLLPAIPISMQVLYTLEDFEMPTQVVFFNPTYLQKVNTFWRSHGLKARRVSTGLIMVTIALEVCSNVHIYGFWPFDNHPYSLRTLTHHYYDHVLPKPFHAMPVEFDLLLRLHSQGVLRLHLGECKPGEQ
ncbi:alpha-2,8-sialyltransferase 8E-like [Pholidichthys leucotaenia]